MDALSCIDQCFIADSMLEDLPAPSSVGKTKVGGIDLNKARMRWVAEALIALCVSPSESQGSPHPDPSQGHSGALYGCLELYRSAAVQLKDRQIIRRFLDRYFPLG